MGKSFVVVVRHVPEGTQGEKPAIWQTELDASSAHEAAFLSGLEWVTSDEAAGRDLVSVRVA